MAHLLDRDAADLDAEEMRELFDYLRGATEPPPRRSDTCSECASVNVYLDPELGEYTCHSCGIVQAHKYYVECWDDHERLTVRPRDGYKPIHHWHERMAQYALQETAIGPEHWCLILGALRAAKPKALCKETLRRVLRSVRLQRYNENWLQIIYRITGYRPPPLLAHELRLLDTIFEGLYTPFMLFKPEGRKNLLNYNFLAFRLLQLIQRNDALPHFPQLKTRHKWLELDACWQKICEYQDWQYLPMPEPPQWLSVPMCEAAWERAAEQQMRAATAAPIARPVQTHSYANRQLLRAFARQDTLQRARETTTPLRAAPRQATRAQLRRRLALRRPVPVDAASDSAESP